MSNSTGIAVLLPASSVGQVSSPGCVQGGSVAQVINLTTGADVSGSFDPYISSNDMIVQLDTVPSTTDTHLVVFRNPEAANVNVRFASAKSIGASAGTNGPVVATGAQSGNVIVQAFLYAPAHNFVPTYISSSFAPTAPATDTITQIAGINISDDIILLLKEDVLSSPDIGISMIIGNASGAQTLPEIVAGNKILSVLDLSNILDVTSSYNPYASDDGIIVGSYAPQANLLFSYSR
jgi:hypothetical protein